LSPGQEVSGIQLACAPLEFAPAVTALAGGSLTYNGGTLFFSAVGTAGAFDAGGGCSNAGGPASLLVACSGNSPGEAAGTSTASNSETLGSDLVGVYSCTSSTLVSGTGLVSAAAGAGTLSVTENGGVLTADYANDISVQGSLTFVATADSAAFPAKADQTIQIGCAGAAAPGTSTLVSMPVTSSSLSLNGSSVVLSVAGTMGSGSCNGASTAAFLLCAK
jgi:hypothetical protein